MQAARSRAANGTRARKWVLRSVVAGTAIVSLTGAGIALSPGVAGAAEFTTCSTGSLARSRTEVDADIPVQQFNASHGTLRSVTVSDQSIHVDTDSKFENKTVQAQTFAARMVYDATFTNPGGLASPPVLNGTIQRVPTTVFAAFDGTLDFLGPSSYVQPTTSQDATTPGTTSTDPAVLAAFTGTGTVPFHLATQISEIFTGAGGNSASETNTFASASVKVCYRYFVVDPTTTTPTFTTPTTRPLVEVLSKTAVAILGTLPLAG
jgi:hypothetical protein